jgi:hypothetical protein
MADYPETRCSQVTAYEGMDRFAVTAAAWQQAEATVADDERVAEVRVKRSSPVDGQGGGARPCAYEYIVESRRMRPAALLRDSGINVSKTPK